MSDPKQCKSQDRLKNLRCQGIPGHCNAHWAYDAGGHLIQWVNKREKDPKWKKIACAWIPPGHANYISPEIMNDHHYLTIWVNNEKEEMLKMEKLENDEQLDEAIEYIDEYLDVNDMDNPELEKLSDLVYEYEERTDIMNR